MKDAPVEQGPIPLTQVLAEEAAELYDLHLSFPNHLSKDERLTHFYDSIHRMTPTRSALCLSGSGIRSATFGLGVLQGLARRNLLNQFDYLSTVSGGGYIGSWLTAWIRRDPQGLNGVCAQLVQQNNTSAPEPEQISWLGNYSSYMSPRLGLLSADSWTLIGTYLRNLMLNWLVLLPFFLAVLTVPLLYRATLSAEAGPQLRLTFAAMGIVLLLTNLTYLHLCRPQSVEIAPK